MKTLRSQKLRRLLTRRNLHFDGLVVNGLASMYPLLVGALCSTWQSTK